MTEPKVVQSYAELEKHLVIVQLKYLILYNVGVVLEIERRC